ncbi:MAG: hypothetical protein LBO09_01295 [Candidatus Peribacteria bacterium]|jgi:hypothetical protein|nr:hypothetical protein [Candidatus Peribacteria bacterium]
MSITIPDSTPKFSSLDLASLLHIQGAEKDAIEQKLIAKEQERINTIYPDPTMAEL